MKSGIIRSCLLKNQDNRFIYVNSYTMNNLNLNTETIHLHFGKFIKKLTIKIDNSLNKGEISLPKQLNSKISIPDVTYDFFINENHLYLGPVIGHLVTARNYRRKRIQKLRFSNYNNVNGLIFLFKKSSMNRVQQTIKGYYYNPKTNSFNDGTFPYPSAVFNRTKIRPSTYRYFKNHVGVELFNYPFTNGSKLNFNRRMSRYRTIKKHLPATVKYTGINSLIKMCRNHQSVYIKPVSLSRGRGIFHIKKLKKGYRISDHKGYRRTVKTTKELSKVLNRKLKKRRTYIVQQEIQFHNSTNKIDFRVYIQKDLSGNWKFSGLETKVAKSGSVISNSKNRERIMPGRKALKQIFKLNQRQTDQKLNELTKLCIKVLKKMEKRKGHLGDAAVDFVMDKNYKIWLLEVQLNYASEKKAYRSKDERRVLPSILPTPFEYAKALSGF